MKLLSESAEKHVEEVKVGKSEIKNKTEIKRKRLIYREGRVEHWKNESRAWFEGKGRRKKRGVWVVEAGHFLAL